MCYISCSWEYPEGSNLYQIKREGYIYVLYFLCPGPWAELIKQDNSAFSMQWCTLNAILPRNFAWLGNNTTHGQMEWFQRNFPNTTLLQTLIHISTLLILQQNYLKCYKWWPSQYKWAECTELWGCNCN